MIRLRTFPYPYKAALAICSDIDETHTLEEFLEIQRFLNTKEKTSMGRGIGLEIGNSFWMYSTAAKDQFTYFKGLTSEPSDSAPIIKDFIKTGHIDAMHSYGNFSKVGGFRRDMATKALHELNKHGCQVDVWIDHGDEFNAAQNIGPNHPLKLGDNPDATENHTDLTLPAGIRFLWKSDLTRIIGQDRNIGLLEVTDWWRTNSKSNKLIQPVVLDDGRKIYSFVRYGFWRKQRSVHLAEVINVSTLKKLKSRHGYMVVYTHFGANSGSEYFIPIESQEALRHLAHESREGEIYVTTTSKLLKYNLAQTRLDWTVKRKDDYLDIIINEIMDEVRGAYVPQLDELQGITFYTPNPTRTRIFIKEQQITSCIRNTADYTGQKSISIPLTSLVWPY
jgi:hypothetical protein